MKRPPDVELARDRSDDLVKRDAIVQTAQNRASNIIEEARHEAEGIRADADTYVLEVLKELEAQLIRNLTIARNGIAKINEERESSRARLQAVYEQATGQPREMVDAAGYAWGGRNL
jgi:hypothetical protein